MILPRRVQLNRSVKYLSRAILYSFGIAAILGAVLVILPKQAPQPLVQKSNWSIEGQFFPIPVNMISHIEVPTEMLRDPSLSLWRSWSPETNGMIGRIKTAAFSPPRYIAIPFHGFPGEYFGSRIFLRCISSDAEIEVAIARTNTQWAMAYLKLPETFCTSDVELIAANANTRSYVGLGTPFSIDILFYLAHTTVFPTLFVVMTTWGLFYAFGFTAIYLAHSRLKAPGNNHIFYCGWRCFYAHFLRLLHFATDRIADCLVVDFWSDGNTASRVSS